MKKISIIIILFLIVGGLTACKVKVPETIVSETDTNEDYKDYFLPSSDSETMEENIGSATVNIESKDYESGISVFHINVKSLNKTTIEAQLSGFDINKKLFIYIDSVLVLTENVSETIEIPFDALITSSVEGNHILSIVQYEADDEYGVVINKASSEYLVRYQSENS